jgi:ribosomal protein L31E
LLLQRRAVRAVRAVRGVVSGSWQEGQVLLQGMLLATLLSSRGSPDDEPWQGGAI